MRCLRLILICVLLGAATTVGVAWGLCGRDVGYGAVFDGGVESIWFRSYETVGFAALKADRMQRTHWMPRHQAAVPAWSKMPFQSTERDTYEQCAGWPFVAMYGCTEYTRHGVPMKGSNMFPQHSMGFPLRPIPLGFTIDTAFYGAIWLGLIVSPGVVRRRVRMRRGLCPSCGYDMRGSDGVCPECGVG